MKLFAVEKDRLYVDIAIVMEKPEVTGSATDAAMVSSSTEEIYWLLLC